MLSDRDRRTLIDIRANILLAQSFVQDTTQEEFQSDSMRLYAVTRAVEIVSEASRRLSPDIRARHPALPWRAIAGIGNVLRHNYDDVDELVLWNTVQDDLPGLLEAVDQELRPPSSR